MSRWQLAGDTKQGLRLERVITRRFGEDRFTWVNLLYFRLTEVSIYVLYFPSRFGLEMDRSCMDLLRTFGENTPTKTSVNFWDPRDEHFGEALTLFGLTAPPGLVLAGGLGASRGAPLDESGVYSISYTEREVLSETDRFIAAVNLAHEVLTKGNSQEIARLIRSRDRETLLTNIGRTGGAARDQLVKLKPKLGLPGGLSISLGGT